MSNDAMKYIGAIDQGTSSTRFILFDTYGSIVDSHQLEITTTLPRPGWVEHDPVEIFEKTLLCMNRVMKKRNVNDVVAIGIANQRETTVVWDKVTGIPVHPALVWLDARTKDVVADLIAENGGADAFRSRCGLPISTYFSGVKLRWLLQNSAAVRECHERGNLLFGTIDSWLIWNLSGGASGIASGTTRHVTDVTNASRTMLMNLKSCQWDASVCKAFDIPMTILPEIRSSAEVFCHLAVDKEKGYSCSLSGVPVAACVGDQQSAMIGQLCFGKGDAKNTYGTGCFMLTNTGTTPVPSRHGLLTTVCFQLGSDQPVVYALEGAVAVAGLAVRWLRDQLKFGTSAEEIAELASQVEDNGDVYFVPAFSGLFAPHWCDDARGVICGLTEYSTREHLCRAAIEAVCFQACEVLDAMKSDSGVQQTIVKVDGGMCANSEMLQFQADIANINVQRPRVLETTAAGAAYAAGLAVGVWTSPEELVAVISEADKREPSSPSSPSTPSSSPKSSLSLSQACMFQPQMSHEKRRDMRGQWDKAIERSQGWVGVGGGKTEKKCAGRCPVPYFIGAAAALTIVGVGSYFWKRK